METLGSIGLATYIVSCLVVGIRLLWLWRRTRQLPELLVGVSLIAAAVVAYTGLFQLYSAGSVTSVAMREGPVFRVFQAVSRGCIAVVAWHVFRPTEGWARLLLGLICLQLATWLLYDALPFAPSDSAAAVTHPVYWWCTFGLLAPHTWITLESLRYATLLRRRRCLGVEEPQLERRFLLWGVGMGAVAISNLVFEINSATTLVIGVTLPITTPLVLVTGLTYAAALWYAFFPEG